ncbi:hypothetical protein E2C01_037874 [Portunus trituberculatus]|uniref:Uncharacterized protein n=1 Tax=Portunus trituberculatus TaxID=210409 RepID=A0A5B7FH01_PORTR|nr:hypothetical protein [Portunus trituberculatus]
MKTGEPMAPFPLCIFV